MYWGRKRFGLWTTESYVTKHPQRNKSKRYICVYLYLLAWWPVPQSKKKLHSQTSAPLYRTPPRLDPEETDDRNAETSCEQISWNICQEHISVSSVTSDNSVKVNAPIKLSKRWRRVPAAPGWSNPPVCCAGTGSAAALACSSHQTWVPEPRWGVWWAAARSSLRCELVWRAPPLMEDTETQSYRGTHRKKLEVEQSTGCKKPDVNWTTARFTSSFNPKPGR